LTYLDGITYFSATDPLYGVELWQTDGTTDGTVLTKDIYPGPYAKSNPSNLITVNNTLFFRAAVVGGNSVYADQVWKLDGAGANHVPAANMSQTMTVLEDPGAVNIGQSFVITDTDVNDLITATLALDNPAAGVLSTTGGTATYNAVKGFWSVTGSDKDVSAALAAVTFTPNADWNGTVNITTHVQDAKGTGPANGQITLKVTAVNDAPMTGDLTLTSAEDNTLVVSGWTFNDTKDQVVGVSTGNNPLAVNIIDLPLNGVLSDNGVELKAGDVVPWADAIGGNVTFQPGANWNGSSSFHFTVQDDGGTANLGQDTSLTTAANITVTEVNDAPVNNGLPAGELTTTQSDPANPYQSVPITYSSATGNAIYISDVDLQFGTASQAYSVTLTTAKAGLGDTGTVHVVDPNIVGLTIVGNDTSAVTLTGALGDINTALDGMQFIPYADSTIADHVYSGTSNANLQIVTSDNGAIGVGDVLSATDTITFTVTPIAHTPENTLGSFNLPGGTSTVSLANSISVHDGDLNDTLFTSISAGTGVSGLSWGSMTGSSPMYIFVGNESYINPLLNSLTANIQPDFYGQAAINVTTTDASGLSSTSTIPISIAVPQLPPSVTPGAVAYTVYEDHSGPVHLGACVQVSDPNSDPLTVDLAVSAGWSGLNVDSTMAGSAVISGGGTTALRISGSMVDVQNTLATLTGTLIPDFNGNANFSVAVKDLNNPVVNAILDVPVIPVNDAPVLTPQGAPYQFVTITEDAISTGVAVSTVVGSSISDVDAAAVQGIAVTGTPTTGAGAGHWEYLDTTASNWVSFGTVDTQHALLLGSADQVRFVGDRANGEAARFDYIAWDQTSGAPFGKIDVGVTGGTTAFSAASDHTGITVTAVNDAPVNLVPLAQQSVNDHAPLVFDAANGNQIAVSDVDAGSSPILVQLTSTNGTMTLSTNSGLNFNVGDGVTDSTMIFTGTLESVNNALDGMTYVSDLGYVGPANVQIITNDQGHTGTAGALLDTDNVGVTVNNAPPVAGSFAVTTNEDTVKVVSGWSFTDVEKNVGSAIEIIRLPDQGTLFLDANKNNMIDSGEQITLNQMISWADTKTSPKVKYLGLSNYNGPDSLQYVVKDSANSIGVPPADAATVSITVNAVNDAPINTIGGVADFKTKPQSINEDTPLVFNATNGNQIVVTDVDLTGVGQVTLKSTNGTLTLGSLTGLTSVVGNGTASVVIKGALSDLNDALDGLTFNPNLNFNGASAITVTTSDLGGSGSGGTKTDTDTLAITVYPVADNPVAKNFAVSINEDTAGKVSGWSFSTVDGTKAQSIRIIEGPQNGTLFLDANANNRIDAGEAVAVGDTVIWSKATTSLKYLGSLNYNGPDSLKYVDIDSKGTEGTLANGDAGTVSVTVKPVNDAPVNTIAGVTDFKTKPQSVNEDTPLVFNAANGNQIVVTDVDLTGGGQVTLKSTNGTLTLGNLAGLTTVTGNGTASVVLKGSLTDINNALDGLTYNPKLNFFGTGRLTITTSDLGSSGSGGTRTDTDSLTITVNSVNDAPVNTLQKTEVTTAINTNVVFSSTNANRITVSDVDAGSSPVEVTLSSTHGAFSLGRNKAGITFLAGDGTADSLMTIKGTLANINNALNGMYLTPDSGYQGGAFMSILTNDLGYTGSGEPMSSLTDIVKVGVGVNISDVNWSLILP
jgi:ELWxxDGT repeat protein